MTSRQTTASIVWLGLAMMSFIMLCFWVVIWGGASTWDPVSKAIMAIIAVCLIVSISCKEQYVADDRLIAKTEKATLIVFNRLGLIGFCLGFPSFLLASQFMSDTPQRVIAVFVLGVLTLSGWALMNYANLRYSSIVGGRSPSS